MPPWIPKLVPIIKKKERKENRVKLRVIIEYICRMCAKENEGKEKKYDERKRS